MESQNKLIKAHLLNGRTITDFDARYLFSCARLAARINDIKKTVLPDGMYIKTTMVDIISGGKKKMIGRYKLEKL